MTAIEILRNEHAVILEALELLERHARAVAGGARLDREFAGWALAFAREFADDAHHAKEEGVLFALLEQRGSPDVTAAVAALRAEHAGGRAMIQDMTKTLAAADDDVFARTALGFTDLMRRHVLHENETLLGEAEKLLSRSEDTAALAAFGQLVHAREGVLVRQRHLAAIERWRSELDASQPSP